MASGDVVYESTSSDLVEFQKNTGGTSPKFGIVLKDFVKNDTITLQGDDNPPSAMVATKQYKITIVEV